MYYVVRWHAINGKVMGPYVVGKEEYKDRALKAAADFRAKHPPTVSGMNTEVAVMSEDEFRAERAKIEAREAKEKQHA